MSLYTETGGVQHLETLTCHLQMAPHVIIQALVVVLRCTKYTLSLKSLSLNAMPTTTHIETQHSGWTTCGFLHQI